MPLVVAANEERTFKTVHDGGFFSKELISQHPRTPESNIALIEQHSLSEIVQPSFRRPHCVTHPCFDQVFSDSKPVSTATDWMAARASRFFATTLKRDAEEKVTPPMKVIPIASWTTRSTKPHVCKVRRNLSMTSSPKRK